MAKETEIKAKEGEVVTPKQTEGKKSNNTIIIVIVVLVILGLCGLCALCAGMIPFLSGLEEGIMSGY